MRVYYGITERIPRRWLSRNTSSKMSAASNDYYKGGAEYAAAVAAAAFAISTLESPTRGQTLQNLEDPMPPLERIRSQRERIVERAPYPRRSSESLSDEEEVRRRVPSSVRKLKPKPKPAREPSSEKIIHPVPSFRQRLPSFSSSKKYTDDVQTMSPDFDPQVPGYPSPFNPPIPPPPPKAVSPPRGPMKPRFEESEADAWERAELEKIKKRYEDLNITILEWEEKKKNKAKRKLDKTEGEVGKKRAKALQTYQTDLERIRQIADGAKAQAKEKRRNEELKVKEKASKYRATGKPPATCLCF